MLDDRAPHTDEPGAPELGDFVRLRPGGRHGLAAGTWAEVVDIAEHAPGVLEVWHQKGHPDYWDWAAAITAADVVDIIRTDIATHPPLTEEQP
ncbi:DUF6211 family protein [Streptomyces sp. NPDC047525]|uniref:DUF6211 family protein n=1 Tax=Streptomyces sp. NPDC047525 TaxID=3155264 RepID=UPI003409D071